MPKMPIMSGYSHRLKILHWVMAVLLLGMLITGFLTPQLSDMSTIKWVIRDAHESFGLLLIPLVFLRVWHRLTSSIPHWKNYPNTFASATSRFVHALFYLLMFALPISGYLTSHPYGIRFFGIYLVNYLPDGTSEILFMTGDADFELAGIASGYHKALAVLFGVLVVIHMIGAFKSATGSKVASV
ncbi:hypothetical protein GCE9029_03492 [Grimontia celer]|uniref:Cytochrome b561 bacterial/Ni-hydrogenase domain-containing protein n=1 Tax=Grimontia celer TaxID=1796497 RepID=A0A128F8P8_9GAMM|nr:cytochrome b/b6 domain-containing protein [Grimontia celer]CZF82870.1 hypothetical protein GCE9029_03492 [Grimontia celer]